VSPSNWTISIAQGPSDRAVYPGLRYSGGTPPQLSRPLAAARSFHPLAFPQGSGWIRRRSTEPFDSSPSTLLLVAFNPIANSDARSTTREIGGPFDYLGNSNYDVTVPCRARSDSFRLLHIRDSQRTRSKKKLPADVADSDENKTKLEWP
jgi:hypothetical protein